MTQLETTTQSCHRPQEMLLEAAKLDGQSPSQFHSQVGDEETKGEQERQHTRGPTALPGVTPEQREE